MRRVLAEGLDHLGGVFAADQAAARGAIAQLLPERIRFTPIALPTGERTYQCAAKLALGQIASFVRQKGVNVPDGICTRATVVQSRGRLASFWARIRFVSVLRHELHDRHLYTQSGGQPQANARRGDPAAVRTRGTRDPDRGQRIDGSYAASRGGVSGARPTDQVRRGADGGALCRAQYGCDAGAGRVVAFLDDDAWPVGADWRRGWSMCTRMNGSRRLVAMSISLGLRAFGPIGCTRHCFRVSARRTSSLRR